MVAEQWLIQAIQAGKSYEQLPKKVQASVPLSDWKLKVKQYCIQHGYSWSDSMANTSSGEQEYYEDLIEYYRKNEWLFPYHLSHFVCRILRVTAFRYYSDLLFNSLKEEKAYDTIPNFTAADVLRHLGIGRTEYISILDACRAKKFIWRVNRNIAREKLPSEPVSLVMEPWWKLGVVNVSENEFRSLSSAELDFLQTASSGGDSLKIGEVGYEMLRSMYKRGLVYLRIPICDDDKFTIPPLEGFISNRNVSSNGSGVDPMETLLYSVFIANSENMTITSLARVLSAEIPEIKNAMGVAVQLGFATRMNGEGSSSFELLPWGENDIYEDLEKEKVVEKNLFPTEEGLEQGQAAAVLVDAETTSFLMMGLLSSGIKRHAVTLFEGGRVAGDEVISHLISELRVSAENEKIDGEIRQLMQTASALAEVLECVREASGNRSIELLRRESLQGLSSEAITRVLSHSYKIIVPIAPLSGDPLPLNVSEATPLFFGATDNVASLWFQLAFYEQVGNGPVSYVFLRGQRISQLPASMQDQQHALLYSFPYCETPHLVSRPFILHHLNELCRHGPTMLQPLFVDSIEGEELVKFDDLKLVDVPLPFEVQQDNDQAPYVNGYEHQTGVEIQIPVESSLCLSLETLGLTHAIGYITFSKNMTSDLQFIPFRVHLGLPLAPLESCKAVCLLTKKRSILDSSQSSEVLADVKTRMDQVSSVLDRFGKGCEIEVSPSVNLCFDGKQLRPSTNLEGGQGMDITDLDFSSEFVPSINF